MSGKARLLVLLGCDFLLVIMSLLVSLFIRFPSWPELSKALVNYINFAPVCALVMLVFFYFFGLYQRVWAYASIGELVTIVKAVTTGKLVVIALTYFIFTPLPRSVVLMSWAFSIILIGGSRLCWRIYVQKKKFAVAGCPLDKRKTLIVGAGDAGVLVVRELMNHNSEYLPVGFIDDDASKQGMVILGIPVLGKREELPLIIEKYRIKEVIIAMPSVSGQVIKETVEKCHNSQVKLKILPGVYQLISGQVTVNHIRDIQVEDLLGREPVEVDLSEIAGYLTDRVVLVSGAGGSIGSELCRQVVRFKPKLLVVLGHGENSIHNIVFELREMHGSDLPIEIVIADIRDRQKINLIFKKYRPSVVFHAAAHKHVPLMELHPDESVKTNVLGTKNLAEAADRVGTDVFIMLSTDKAVNPSSVMGATKRLAELILQQMNSISDTVYAAVRFGNVLGSNGSVVPIFKRQIAQGGPVTVTHPEMKRYFMTIPEAVQLVIQAGAMAQGGEIFVLDMGEPVKIVDLAKCIIDLSGVDCEIKFTGIRPGEKLFEELLTAEEGSSATRHRRIFVANAGSVNLETLELEILRLRELGWDVVTGDVFKALTVLLPNIKIYRKDMVG
jgi:FlaA1/EpsC-like NDP-sugar epimerase